MAEKNKLIQLGSCARPHGIKGGLSPYLFNLKDSVLKQGVSVLLIPKTEESSLPEDGRVMSVKSASFGNKCILYLEGVETREEAQALIPFDIYIRREALPRPKEGELYIEDLNGLKVVDGSGRQIGVVKDYFDNGAQIVLVIKKDREEIELPFVQEFFPNVDLEAGIIEMNEPEIV